MRCPRIALCSTCKGRAQHLEQTLPQNLADNATYENAVFVVLDYGSTDHLLEFLKAKHSRDIDSGRLVVYSFSAPGAFKMAHAKNMAHRCGILEGADILVNLDADNLTGEGFAEYIAEQFQTDGIFLWAKMVKHVMPRGISGRIVVSRNAFLNAGGYHERFETWGHDDKDFNERLTRLGYTGVEIAAQYLDGVRHNNKMRFREYPHAAVQADLGEDPVGVDREYTTPHRLTTIANFGKFGMGTVFRNFETTRPIELAAVPTRIFGIGMHKTGTTSLHTALEILGFESAHWKSAHWAKRIWNEMNAWGRSQTLERHYALTDLPIPLLYKELDVAYPGSKFILTMRNEEAWLRSVENHWNPELNKFRGAWDTDPFTHKIHKELYGQKGFNEELFLARYRRHNLEVQEYFRNRTQDLLVMHMDGRGSGWPFLCGLLHQAIPSVPYPRAFVTPRPISSAEIAAEIEVIRYCGRCDCGHAPDHPHFIQKPVGDGVTDDTAPLQAAVLASLPDLTEDDKTTQYTPHGIILLERKLKVWKLWCVALVIVLLWLIALIFLFKGQGGLGFSTH